MLFACSHWYSLETLIGSQWHDFFLFFHRPPPKLVWKKNGVVLKSGIDFIEIPEAFEGRLLSITNVKESLHETTFTCEASNNQTEASGPAQRNFVLNVEGKL